MIFQMPRDQKLKQAQQKIQKKCTFFRKSTFQASKIISIRSIIFYFLLMMLPLIRCQDFNNNLILNGDFSQPRITNRTQYFSFSILGWSCTRICEVKNCKLGRKYWLQQNRVDTDCTGQAIDLNSDYTNEVVTQKVDLTAGKYILHFNYYYPAYSSKKKQLKVTLNNQDLLYVWPQVDISFDLFQYESQVQAIEGQNVLAFANLGLNDGTGFKINNVSLYRMVDNDVLDWLDILSEKVSNLNTCPGFRVVFRNLLGFLINFDRLELYIYHNRRYSYNIQQMLVSMNKFFNAKSNAAIGILHFLDENAIQNQEKLIQFLQFKEAYNPFPSFSQDYKEASYLDNLNESFVYFFPFLLLLLIILNILFCLFYQNPISLAFRKFSLWAIALIMIFDGNIETLTFFTLTEFKIFFSSCFSHKILNVFILFLFFLLVFIAFGLLHWGKFHYKKKVKFLLDEQDSKMAIVWGIIIDRGIICFLFGVIHCMLLDLPSFQLILLIILEISWIGKKVLYIRKDLNDKKYLVLTSILSGCCRVVFQISCIVYEYHAELRVYISEVIHAYIIYSIISLSLLQFAVGCIYSYRDLMKICLTRSNKISHHQYHEDRFLENPLKEKTSKRSTKYDQNEQETNIEAQAKKLLKEKSVYFYPRRQNIKPKGSYATFQNELIIKTRTRIIKYYQ